MSDTATAPATESTPASAEGAAPPAPEAKAAPAAATEAAKRKVKVDGAEVEVTDEELVKGYQLEASARKRMTEASTQLKQAKELEAKLKAGGAEALRAAGWSDEQIEKLSMEILATKQKGLLEQERQKSLDPKERELEELRKLKEQHEDEKKKADATKREAEVTRVHEQMTQATIATLDALPESMRGHPVVVNRVLDVLAEAIENTDELQKQGVKLTPQWAADRVMKELRQMAREAAASAKDEELEEMFPPTVRARWAKAQKAMAETTAHPALTATPQVREKVNGNKEAPPRVPGTRLLRRLSGPSSA